MQKISLTDEVQEISTTKTKTLISTSRGSVFESTTSDQESLGFKLKSELSRICSVAAGDK